MSLLFYSLIFILFLLKTIVLTNLECIIQAEAVLLKNDSKTVEKQVTTPASIKGQSQTKSGVQLSKEVRY